jgi:hypothetical protein
VCPVSPDYDLDSPWDALYPSFSNLLLKILAEGFVLTPQPAPGARYGSPFGFSNNQVVWMGMRICTFQFTMIMPLIYLLHPNLSSVVVICDIMVFCFSCFVMTDLLARVYHDYASPFRLQRTTVGDAKIRRINLVQTFKLLLNRNIVQVICFLMPFFVIAGGFAIHTFEREFFVANINSINLVRSQCKVSSCLFGIVQHVCFAFVQYAYEFFCHYFFFMMLFSAHFSCSRRY